MSNKLHCPGCDGYTSSIWQAVMVEGENCPNCGLTPEAIQLVTAAQERNADEKLLKNYTSAVQRAEAAEAKVRDLTRQLDQIRAVLA